MVRQVNHVIDLSSCKVSAISSNEYIKFVLHIANTVVGFSSYIQVVYLHMGTILEAFHHYIRDASITPENAIIMNLPEIDFKQNY